MSLQQEPPSPPPVPSFAMPISILVAFALEGLFVLARFVLPVSWYTSERYFLISTGLYSCSAVLVTMGFADLARRLPDRQASGARMAMVTNVALLVMVLAGGVINYVTSSHFDKAELIWNIQSYLYLAIFLAASAGLVIAAGGFSRFGGPAIALFALAIVLAPPPFLATKIYSYLGSSARYVYAMVSLAQLGLQVYLIREAARSSTRDLPPEPTGPFALLGSALRTRVIAVFVLAAFTVFAMGGRSAGAMKFAMVATPLINMIAFLVFAIAALRAGRGLGDKLQIAFALAGGAAAWCAGVLALQTPAIYQALGGGGDSFSGERNTEMAQALSIAMPLVATLGVVLALVAVGSHVRRLGHHDVAESIVPRTTVFVILMLVSVVIQISFVPKVTSMNELIALGLLAAAAGVAALLVAANIFKRASEATSGNALPTATVLP